MISTVVLVLFALLLFGCNATDYCNEELCPNGSEHIGCNNNNRFAERCESPQLIEFGRRLQKLVLEKHNIYRNDVASGTNFSSAVRMRVLTWNKELAKLAEYNVRQCTIKPDECLNTDDFPACGQNVGSTAIKYGTEITDEVIDLMVNRVLDNWYAESIVTHHAWLERYTTNTYGNVIFHFTTMMQDRVTEIGCSAIKYTITVLGVPHKAILVTCNYSFTNIIGHPVYVNGAVASKCKTGPDIIFTSLCSSLEAISAQFKQDGPKIRKKKKCRPRRS